MSEDRTATPDAGATPDAVATQQAAPRGAGRPKNTIVLLSVIVVLVLVVAKLVTGSPTPADTAPQGGTITSQHNDAVADYAAAVATDKPVYVLFHSLTCEPCVEISAVVDRVIPSYEGRVVFVNAISDDPSGRELSSRFAFQYIPTSFFLAPGGEVKDSFTGSMDESKMRGYLDALVAGE